MSVDLDALETKQCSVCLESPPYAACPGRECAKTIALLAEVRALREDARWIPVSEKLPEHSGDYLCWWRRAHGVALRVVMQFEDGRFWKGHGSPTNVTHWMSLRKAPGAERKEPK